MADSKRYEFSILALGKDIENDGFNCFFNTDSFETDTSELYNLLKTQVGGLDHIHLTSGLMVNILVEGAEGCKEWSDKVSNLVSFDTKEEALFDQKFYFLEKDGVLQPSNQLQET